MPPKKLPKSVELTFRSGHSLIIGHKPESLCAEGLCENLLTVANKDSITSFGLFGGSADPNKFYPDLSPDDWTPKDADFIEPVFRGLSETFVSHWGIPISFKKEGVLKKSMNLLKGVTINTNHDTETENAVGAVSNVVWQTAYKSNGVNVPAGINMVMKIDAKSNPRLARGIQMSPPSIHSNSVTVRFSHEQSHMDMKPAEFWEQVGNYDKKGDLIHVVVNKITAYKETSLVNHGADPYAQKVDGDGVINDAEGASKVYDFSEDNTNQFLNTNTDNMDFLEFIAKLGLTEEAIPNEEALVAHFKAISENQTPEGVNVANLQADAAELTTLKGVVEDITPDSLTTLVENQRVDGETILEEGQEIISEAQAATLAAVEEAGDVPTLVSNADAGLKALNTVRANAVAQYKLANKDTINEDIVSSIQKADLKVAAAFEAQYAAEFEKQNPLKCMDCESVNISRGVANAEAKDKPKGEESFEETRDRYAKSSRKGATFLHGEASK